MEVAWRQTGIRPIPDSMSQFADFATLFPGQTLHCGLVTRQDHRHWVHVIGTPYDLIEWDVPLPQDLGVGFPTPATALLAPATPTILPSRQLAALRLRDLLGYTETQWVQALTVASDDETVATELMLEHSGVVPTPPLAVPPGRLRRPRFLDEDFAGEPPCLFSPRWVSGDRTPLDPATINDYYAGVPSSPPLLKINSLACHFEGVVYDRPLEVYSKEPTGGLAAAEAWIATVLLPIIQAIFPENNQQKKITYAVLLPQSIGLATATTARLMGCEFADQDKATWKEIMVWRERAVVHVFNLVSHGRHVYRTLIYVSDCRWALSRLPLQLSKDQPHSIRLLYQAGDWRTCRQPEGSKAFPPPSPATIIARE